MRKQRLSKIKRQLRKYQKRRVQILKMRFIGGYISISFTEDFDKPIHDVLEVWANAINSPEHDENIPELIVGYQHEN